MQKHISNLSRSHLSKVVICGLLLCLLLLSACGEATTNVVSVKPTPTVDRTLQNEGNAQLQTFKKWIDLMQLYEGNISTYLQQYQADQQALQSAAGNLAYQKALNTLKGHIEAIQLPAMKTESSYLFQELQQDAT